MPSACPSFTISGRKSCFSPGCSGTKPPLYHAYPLVETQKVWMTLTPSILYQAKCVAGSALANAPTLASTGREFIQDVVEHSITVSGFWDPTLDGYLQPEVGLGTKRTAALGMSDGTTTVTYTWTSNCEVSSYEVDMSVGAAGTFSATFTCSGAPGRASA